MIGQCFTIVGSSRKAFEQKALQDEEKAYQIEAQLKEAQLLAEEADRKYDEVRCVRAASPCCKPRVPL